MKIPATRLLSLLLAATPVVAQDLGVTFVNGVNTFLEAPYSPQLIPQSGITVEAWVTYDDTPITAGVWRHPTIVRQNPGAGAETYFLRVNAQNLGSRVLRWKVVTSNGVGYSVDWTFAAGQLAPWTHVAGTFDGTSTKLYVNGVVVAQNTLGNGLPLRDNGGVFRIGTGDDATSGGEVWSGSIDEVRVWPFARSQAEITASMNQKHFFVPGAVATWNLDGFLLDTSSGLVLTDNNGVPFTTNPLVFSFPAMPVAIGTSTPGCLGPMRLSPTVPALANTPFGVVCTRTQPNALAIWAATFGVLPFGVPVFGFDLWVDPTVLITFVGTANGLGVLPFNFTLSGTEPPGFAWAMQAIVLDTCGSQGFAASDAMVITVQ